MEAATAELEALRVPHTLIECCTMGWNQADREHPDKAQEAHDKELHSLFIVHKACHPVHYDGTSKYHNSHDLFDIKHADDSAKSRLVVGKVKGGGDSIDAGVDLYSPTMDLKLITMMLSVALEEDLELSVKDVTSAFIKSDMKVRGVLVKLKRDIVDRLLGTGRTAGALGGVPTVGRHYDS